VRSTEFVANRLSTHIRGFELGATEIKEAKVRERKTLLGLPKAERIGDETRRGCKFGGFKGEV
jgi:hypothetical protein